MGRYRSHEELKTIRVHGHPIKISVDSEGDFRAMFGGEHFRSKTLVALEGQIRKVVKKLKGSCSIKATLLGEDKYAKAKSDANPWDRRKWLGKTGRPITLTGVDARRQEITYQYDDEKKVHRLSRYSARRGTVAKPMGPIQIAEYEKLEAEKRRAEAALDRFLKRWSFEDYEKKVQAALASAVDDPKEPEEEESEDPRL